MTSLTSLIERIDAEHIATACALAKIAWRAQRAINEHYGATLNAVRRSMEQING